MRWLRLAAWSVFSLDLVILAQLAYGLLLQRSGAEPDPVVRGLSVMLGSGLSGIAILLIVSSRLRSQTGLWLSLGFAAVPLLWTLNAIFESMWQ